MLATNLHVSNFGAGTTREQIQYLFGQYVTVKSVIWKEVRACEERRAKRRSAADIYGIRDVNVVDSDDTSS